MRCPDCSKFVSMENGEPDVSDLVVEYSDGTCHVTASVHHTRNCADCSTELKDYDYELEDAADLESFSGWEGLTKEERDEVLTMLKDGTIEPDVQAGDAEIDEGGGGRYQKNMITLTVPVTITIDGSLSKEKELHLDYSLDLIDSAAAGDYNECC